MTAKLAIDWTRCDGHGLCMALLPGAVTRDDWGYPVLDDRALARQRPDDLKRAVATCPALALRLSEASEHRASLRARSLGAEGGPS
jgi:ferredoxin